MERMGGFYSSIWPKKHLYVGICSYILDGNCAFRKPPLGHVGIRGPKSPIVFFAIRIYCINVNMNGFGLRAKLQETLIFSWKNQWFSCNFPNPLKKIYYICIYMICTCSAGMFYLGYRTQWPGQLAVAIVGSPQRCFPWPVLWCWLLLMRECWRRGMSVLWCPVSLRGKVWQQRHIQLWRAMPTSCKGSEFSLRNMSTIVVFCSTLWPGRKGKNIWKTTVPEMHSGKLT